MSSTSSDFRLSRAKVSLLMLSCGFSTFSILFAIIAARRTKHGIVEPPIQRLERSKPSAIESDRSSSDWESKNVSNLTLIIVTRVYFGFVYAGK